jgi:cyclic beta-1,2-glucan synthetase
VGTDDNWLPPDNFQEEPRPTIASRTSPTNVGLLLLSTVAARDFGYLGLLETVERLELTFRSLSKLEKFHGHFFNWYDTRTLAPLVPQYVSTVDSGNLAGHLIAVKQAAIELPEERLFDARLLHGLADGFTLLREEARQLSTMKERSQVVTFKQLNKEIEACLRVVETMNGESTDLSEWSKLFEDLSSRLGEIKDIAHALEQEQGTDTPESFADCRFWIGSLQNQIRTAARDLNTLVAWGSPVVSRLMPLIEGAGPEFVARLQEISETVNRVPTVGEISDHCTQALSQIRSLSAEVASNGIQEPEALCAGLDALCWPFEACSRAVSELLQRASAIAHTCDELLEAMDFHFLFDDERKMFLIGYNVSDGRGDKVYYDLLASEARLTSLVAIAKGDAPQEHWFRLGRQLAQTDGSRRALVSWTGTMFEYLMPLLITRHYPDTLLEETFQAIVAGQIAYGRERGVPWGVSESGYNARDLQFNYQYGPFGVPGLGLKRGLSEDLVIAPYATVLAAMVAPRAALQNMQRLMQSGALGRYGFYEAIDYTLERLPQNQKYIVIHSFMTHHQGMSLVALDNVLHDEVMQKRFHADPLIQATELLLQERVPQAVPVVRFRTEEVLIGRVTETLTTPLAVHYDSPHQSTPRTQLISNGTYTVMVTSAGAGYSMCGAHAVTRWREDVTRDNWGSFCYVRDVRSGAVWSTGFQPTARAPESYEVTFMEDRAVFKRLDAGILTQTEIVVSPEDNAEVRRVSVTNRSTRTREIELTSYAEVVLTTPATDAAHPAFSNLFIETEFNREENSIIARRRPRSAHDTIILAVHTIATEGDTVGAVQYETSRQSFLGRGHDVRTPRAIMEDRPLSNTVGAVLDPIFSLRQRVRLKPNETARITFSTAVTYSRESVLLLADKYHDISIFERVERLAWTNAQIQMRHLNIDAREAHLFQRLGGRVLYCENSLRPRSSVLALNKLTQSDLWRYGISGDLPIVLVRIGATDHLEMVRQILRGHEYLRLKGLQIDLVILNDHPTSYFQTLHDGIQTLIRSTGLQPLEDKPGGVYVRRSDVMPDEDRILLHTVARVVLVTERGTLEEQLARRTEAKERPAVFAPRLPERTYPSEPAGAIPRLQFFNGLGGFARDGREYLTVLNEGQWTPAPWTNVIANEQDFGFQVTDTGGGYTWSVNSRENRLTPWSNDAVSDPPGEVVYLRDEETGAVWTTTPLPIREAEPYFIRHGQGYTVFEHTSHGIAQELLLFVPLDSPVKIARLRLRNQTDRRRRLSVTTYNELVLGVSHEKAAPFLVTERDKDSGAILARNTYNNEFANRIAFTAMHPEPGSVSCDRRSFLGRNGHPALPAALSRTELDGRLGGGLDPCVALQTVLDIAPGESREVIILLGESDSVENAREILTRYLEPEAINEAYEGVVSQWDQILSSVRVRTPDVAMNVMLNRWLLYQTLACRIWARSAFYQSGGAYGFRDQLQDVMALVYSRPDLARAQILRASAHQFPEGDVQHWWHPPTGRGVRTRISDDLLWLPYVAQFYTRVTGDASLLDEITPFLDAPPLVEGEDESYQQPQVSPEQATLYDHCLRAIDRSLVTGEHGLPLMGTGDWNDGMNRVGHGGKGESVWLGWFLCTVLEGFIPFCNARRDPERSARYQEHITKLKAALESSGWDGDWYRRAYFDDGTPLGSALSDECRIDSIAQSWGLLSGAADNRRVARAMAAVEEHLIRRGDGLVLLLTPPFDSGSRDPGYIKGYVPGVRENGGQYTHAALWTVIAYTVIGDGDRAGELFALVNPINHSSTRAGLHKYRVEPYVAASDVYAVPPHTGRGGWTWYTGSASWMYRAGLESILGFHLSGDRLRIDPCIPREWREFEISYQRGSTGYLIKVENPHGVCRGIARLEIDGKFEPAFERLLSDDGHLHKVRVVLGERPDIV